MLFQVVALNPLRTTSGASPDRASSVPLTTVFLLVAILVAACGRAAEPDPPPDPLDWESVRVAAEGSEVRWWMFGGDERVNRYVDEFVTPAAAGLGIVLVRVPVSDTSDAVQRVLAEAEASVEAGRIDLIWINGENFALGKQVGLWMQGWSRSLPNSVLVDWDDQTISHDFGVAVEGEESPWSRAAFVFAYDPDRTPNPPTTFEDVVGYAREHPGRVTYPAPPDFTGSAFVRLAVQTLGEDEAFSLLGELKPFLWRDGETYPGSEAELNRLFGDGQVDFAMSYNPGFVEAEVRRGTFAPSTRPFIMDDGTLHNVSYVTIPARAPNPAGALVVADLLLEPRLQALKADPEILGLPSVLDLELLSADDRTLLDEASVSPYILAHLGPAIPELSSDRVIELEERWRREVLR